MTLAAVSVPSPDYSLEQARRALARSYGFGSWDRLRDQVGAIEARTWVPTEPVGAELASDRFLRLACLDWSGSGPADAAGRRRRVEAAQLLGAHPELPADSIAVAAVSGNRPAVAQHLARDPASAARPIGPHGWSPLLYLAYARLETELDPGSSALVAVADALLEAGADPNDGRFFLGWPTPFTVLTGLIGGGEDSEPPHRHWRALARTLLVRGANPNDGQALYNRMFTEEDDFLELLFEFGLGTGDGGPWRRLLPDLLESPAVLLRALLAWAVSHDQRQRTARLAEHGVDVLAPLDDAGFLSQPVTPIELAVSNGHLSLAQQLRRLGAAEPTLDPVRTYLAAVLAEDAEAARETPPEVRQAARQSRPGAIVWAAGQERLLAVELLIEAGWDVNALGRADLPVEQPWQTALHTAVERGNALLAQRLLDLGAERELRDARFNSTAADWARHLGRPQLLTLLSPDRPDDAA